MKFLWLELHCFTGNWRWSRVGRLSEVTQPVRVSPGVKHPSFSLWLSNLVPWPTSGSTCCGLFIWRLATVCFKEWQTNPELPWGYLSPRQLHPAACLQKSDMCLCWHRSGQWELTCLLQGCRKVKQDCSWNFSDKEHKIGYGGRLRTKKHSWEFRSVPTLPSTVSFTKVSVIRISGDMNLERLP